MSKIKVMLVDDEPLAIEDMQDIICWEDLGFEITATAHNGKQALRKFKENRPDLVITDIDMPIMDGIALARELRALDERVRVILLTAYSDFNYAREGFRYGVDDYMLKNEISEASLTQKLQQIKEHIFKARKLKSILTQEEISNYLNSTDSEELADSDEYRKKYLYLILEEDFPCIYYEKDNKNSGHIREILACQLGSIAGCKISMAVKLTKTRVLWCIEDNYNLSLFSFRSAAEKLISELSEKYNTSFTSFLSYPAADLHELKRLYSQIKERFTVKYFLGCGKVYEIEKTINSVDTQKVKLDLQKVMLLCTSADKTALQNYICEKYDEASEKFSYRALMEITAVFSMMLTSVLGRVSDNAESTKEFMEIAAPDCYSAEEVKQWMLAQFRNQGEKMDGSRSLSSAVVHAVEYIHENYGDYGLKIEKIAENVGISSSRLSVLFKKEMNCTVNEYLTSFRIVKAKALLQEKRYKIYEIATKVGYGSSQYFSQVFLQKVGVVPTEYVYGGYDDETV